ncbi:MAG TPA: GNAT family N-acetyltransferase [Cellvibrio sp.]|nr:GNAT family N-acetyltransferase [Cellvibrio sp.]
MNHKFTLPPGVNLRLAGADDEPFLRELFCSIRTDLALLPLPQAQLEQLIRQQYDWQQKGYASQYSGAENWIIENQSVAVGKVTLHRAASRMHIIDFIMTQERRGQGLGGAILRALQSQVNADGGILSLRVDRQNLRAKQLYQRLGFIKEQSTDTHELLVWPSLIQSC